MNWIRWYPYVAPVVLAPASLYLWWHSHVQPLVLAVAWGVPVLWAYIVPGLGTNVFKVWAFNTRFKLGQFRWHHGFVFGSATAMLVWLIHPQAVTGGWQVAQFALIEACVLGFINWVYEVKALQAQVLVVHNAPAAQGLPAEAVAYDYAPWFFGGFGAAHGACLGLALWHADAQLTPLAVAAWAGAALWVCMAVPVLGFMQASWRRHGQLGLRPIHRVGDGGSMASEVNKNCR